MSTFEIRDNTETNKIVLSGSIDPGEIKSFDFSNKLNKSNDTVKLISTSDNTNYDSVTYGNSSLPAPSADTETIGRKPDGSGQFILLSSPSKSQSNNGTNQIDPPSETPTNAPTPTRSPTPSKIPTPTKTPTPIKEATPTKSPTPTKILISVSNSSGFSITKSTEDISNVVVHDVTSIPISSHSAPTQVLAAETKSEVKSSKTTSNTLDRIPKKKFTLFSFVAPLTGLMAFVSAGVVFYRRRKASGDTV